MKTIYKTLVISVMAMALLLPMEMSAKKKVTDIYEMSLDDNLETPEINNDKQRDRILDYQLKTALELKKNNYDVELMREDEIVVITIPASALFEANETNLTKLGASKLKPLLQFLKNPGFYKMLLVMHSDDTGSDAYTVELTKKRVNEIFDWIDDNADVDYVVPYALGPTDPLDKNDSLENRRRNRRLEIYLVPEEVMLNQAKKGKVNINQIVK